MYQKQAIKTSDIAYDETEHTYLHSDGQSITLRSIKQLEPRFRAELQRIRHQLMENKPEGFGSISTVKVIDRIDQLLDNTFKLHKFIAARMFSRNEDHLLDGLVNEPNKSSGNEL